MRPRLRGWAPTTGIDPAAEKLRLAAVVAMLGSGAYFFEPGLFLWSANAARGAKLVTKALALSIVLIFFLYAQTQV